MPKRKCSACSKKRVSTISTKRKIRSVQLNYKPTDSQNKGIQFL